MRGDVTTSPGKQEDGVMKGKVTTSQRVERLWRWLQEPAGANERVAHQEAM
jgi:hypothetical protein